LIKPNEYYENQSWILFYLNQKPIFTEQDGDYNALAIMDVATGLIHGMQMEPLKKVISEFEARLLLKQTEEKANGLPVSIYLASNLETHSIASAARSMNIKVVPKSYNEIYPIIAEAVSGFAMHVSA